MSDIDYESHHKTLPLIASQRTAVTVSMYVIVLHGGPCDGQRVGVSSDQIEVMMSIDSRPVYHVWEINHVVKVGLYQGARDIKK